jgi:hypothetical protein
MEQAVGQAKENTMMYASRRIAGRVKKSGVCLQTRKFLPTVWIRPQKNWEAECLTVLSPLVLTTDLLLFLRGEIIGDVECLSDFLGRLALDHVRDSLTTNVEEGLDVEIVGSLGELVSKDLEINICGSLTRIISNSISWSTCMNFWSHSSISVVFLRESESSSAAAGGSFLWCSHHSITFLRTDSLT